MKKRKKTRAPRRLADTADYFARGFIATGLLAALQDRSTTGKGDPPDLRRILRQALQGGTALAAGGVATDALRQDSPMGALLAVAAGAAALAMIGHYSYDTEHQGEMA